MRQNKRFAAWFAAARRAVHLTQEQLAERMGVSQPTIGYWETEGRLSMEPEEIRRLAVHLRVEPVVVAEALGSPVRSQGASADDEGFAVSRTTRAHANPSSISHLPPAVEQFRSIGRRLEELRRDWAELDRQIGAGEGEASPPSRDVEHS
jgi:transcriptional regulator with XRE-family HTH domain